MTSTSLPLRWIYTVPTPLGDTESRIELDDDALRFYSDDPMGPGDQTLRWDAIDAGGTAAMQGMGGRGAPQMARWIPARLEWLLVSHRVGTVTGGRAPPAAPGFMRVLPQGADRAAIVAAVRGRLGTRWIGEQVPLLEAQKRLGIAPDAMSQAKVWGIVVAVMAALVGLILLMGILLHPVISVPAGFAFGGWIFRKGLVGLRDAIAVANTPTAKASSAAIGRVELEGRAITERPVASGITARPSVWWDVAVYLWYEDGHGHGDGEWEQVAARWGGNIDVVTLEDDTGRLPVWLYDADLLLETQIWKSDRDTLPPAGAALLDELGFPFNGTRLMRVSERCVEAGGTLYVLGTLGIRRQVPPASEASALDKLVRLWRSGRWKRELVAAFPRPMRIVVAVLIGYLDMMVKLGQGGERPERAEAGEEPPPMAPDATLVWKGRDGHPFLVSNRPETAALAALRRRSLMLCAVGIGVMCYALYALVDAVFGR
ncbi:MAG: hypothetical protein ABIO45_13675 [Burkholderiaceae bacterium]